MTDTGPKYARNFWIELEVAGRKTAIEASPQSGTGGFNQTIRIRERGKISPTTLNIAGFVGDHGRLCIEVVESTRVQSVNKQPDRYQVREVYLRNFER